MKAIEIKNLRKEFKDFDLDIENLEIPEGAVLGLIGENGAGKSTISNAFKKVKGEDILNIETASLYDDSHEISIGESGDKAIFVFNEDFVNDKVKIQEEGLGSIIMLGEKVDLTVKIEQATEKLSEAKDIQDKIK